MNELFGKFRRAVVGTILIFTALASLMFSPRRRQEMRATWLFGERFDEAQDNAFHLFKYIRLHHPQVKAKYVISANARDRKKIEELGDCIPPHGIEHYKYWMTARFLISAHHGYLSPAWGVWNRLIPRKLKMAKSVMLQHGVTAIQMHTIKYARTYPHALITAVSERERQLLIESGGHSSDAVQVLGFARFDALKEGADSRRQILFMPTWRRWLAPGALGHRPGQRSSADGAFESSLYYQSISTFLNHHELHRILSENDYEFLYFPHPNMQSYADSFEVKNPRVKIGKATEHDLQNLIKQSAILISDFSSVTFDFAFMKRPIIYYHFDIEEFFAGGHRNEQGFFDFKKNGFGPQVFSAAELIEEIRSLLRTESLPSMTSPYKERAESFFAFHDQRNCTRIYDRLRSMESGEA